MKLCLCTRYEQSTSSTQATSHLSDIRNQNAKSNGVSDKVTFRNEDLFTADISQATVVTLYLLPSLNLKLAGKLMKDLKPGTRVVSHAFDMGDWKPEKELDVDGRKVYFWTIPKK